MRKKGGRVNMWGERYFSLRGPTLYYYLKATDSVIKIFYKFYINNNNNFYYFIL